MDLQAMLPVKVAVTAWGHRVNWEATLECPQEGSCEGTEVSRCQETQREGGAPIEHEKKCAVLHLVYEDGA